MTAQPQPRSRPAAQRLAAIALSIYPPAWQDRYRAEMQVLLEDTGVEARTVTSLARGAIVAWVRPPANLYRHDPAGRARASLATVLAAWTVLAGLGLVFGQLNETQGLHTLTPGHPLTQWSYRTYALAAHISVAVVIIGGLPLWCHMLRFTHRQRRRAEGALLLAPVAIPILFLGGLIATAKVVRHPGNGIGVWWFLAFTVLGFAAAVGTAAGPALALRRLRPTGRPLLLAVAAAAIAAGTMAVAASASIADAVGLTLWADHNALSHTLVLLVAYLPVTLAAAAIATISSIRGLQAMGAGT